MVESVSDFQTQVLNQKGPVLVDFFAKWCQPCKALDTILTSFKSAPIIKVDVEKAGGIAELYMVSSLPTVVAFRDGDVVGALEGVHKIDKYEGLFAL